MKKLQRDRTREFPYAKITQTHGGHFKLVLPNGRPVFVASTPSCRRNMRNVRRDIRRQLNKLPDH